MPSGYESVKHGLNIAQWIKGRGNPAQQQTVRPILPVRMANLEAVSDRRLPVNCTEVEQMLKPSERGVLLSFRPH